MANCMHGCSSQRWETFPGRPNNGTTAEHHATPQYTSVLHCDYVRSLICSRLLNNRNCTLRQPDLSHKFGEPPIRAKGIKSWLVIQPYHANGPGVVSMPKPLKRGLLIP